jgi:1-acyl-sn-glycerol-3-phosphate acyltransferase
MPERPTDDPVALRSDGMCRFFEGVMRRQMAGGFRAVRLLEPGLPQLPDAPLVVYCNHPSWWDPAFAMVLQRTLMRERECYGPIEAAMLERYGFMRRIGLFGIEPGRRAGAARFLRVGAHVLSDPRRMIWMTAQGRFADPRERPAAMRPGLAHLLARVPRAVAVPVALEYPFWSEKRPEALAAFGDPLRPQGDAEGVQAALEQALEATQDRLAEAAMARDAAAFRVLIGGGRGVGGFYGAWQRLRALAAGRRYDPDHLTQQATD